MVSVDHFGYELRHQLREAAANGANELLELTMTFVDPSDRERVG